MKKNNKGFFLAETIIIVALVTTVMAFVYPNVSKLYDNYKNTSLYYDQTEDLYTLKAYSEDKATDIIGKCNDLINLPEGSSFSYKICEGNCGMGIQKLFIYEYMDSPSSDTNYNFNKYLKRLKKTSNDQNACRLVGVFDGGKFASIKIEKESLYRQLYSVPILRVGEYFIFGNDVIDCTSSNSDGLYVEKINNEWNIEAKVPGDYVLTIKINDSDQIQVVAKVK